MKKVYQLFYLALLGALILSALIIIMPNSIDLYYDNPQLYDNGFSYYMWKFRPYDRDIFGLILAWVLFFAHFAVNIWLLKKLKEDQANKKEQVSKYNIGLLIANAGFIVLHYIHTWIWYDALAQNTPVWSSQGSVIIMLVLILILENKRRGVFFGKSLPLPKQSSNFIVKHHGKYIVLATVFTFWYHPMEFTWGHIFGFFYMFLLFIQISFARTQVHYNKYFKVALEVMVLFHGTFVALYSNNAPWSMFLFGFAVLFFVTQIYGLGLSKRQIIISQLLFVVATIVTYSGLFTDLTWLDLNEIVRIPIIEYALIFVFVFIIYIPFYLQEKFHFKVWVKRSFIIIISVLLGLSAIFVVYVSGPYTAEPDMFDEITLDSDVSFNDSNDSLVYSPEDYEVNIIFIPGGKVEPYAYSYLASELANNGYHVTIVKTPFNLAILQPYQASKYIEDDKVNVVMGHSLGGVVASMLASKYQEIDQLILLGSYNIEELDIPTFIITAEHDIMMDQEAFDANTSLLSDATIVEIEGANHAGFGWYGEQNGDGISEIPIQVQQDTVVAMVTQFIESKLP
jgi:hypothetical protein